MNYIIVKNMHGEMMPFLFPHSVSHDSFWVEALHARGYDLISTGIVECDLRAVATTSAVTEQFMPAMSPADKDIISKELATDLSLLSLFRPPTDLQNLPQDKTDYIGTLCSVCRQRQFNTPFGVCCSNGHGGADGIPDPRKL